MELVRGSQKRRRYHGLSLRTSECASTPCIGCVVVDVDVAVVADEDAADRNDGSTLATKSAMRRSIASSRSRSCRMRFLSSLSFISSARISLLTTSCLSLQLSYPPRRQSRCSWSTTGPLPRAHDEPRVQDEQLDGHPGYLRPQFPRVSLSLRFLAPEDPSLARVDSPTAGRSPASVPTLPLRSPASPARALRERHRTSQRHVDPHGVAVVHGRHSRSLVDVYARARASGQVQETAAAAATRHSCSETDAEWRVGRLGFRVASG